MFYVKKAQAEKCAKEIIAWMKQHDLWSGVSLFVNGKKYSSSRCSGCKLIDQWKDEDLDETYYLYESEDEISRVVEYYNKKHFISMTFEGPLYEILNFYGDSLVYDQKREEEFSKILEKYGYYYELGYAWSLSAYEM